MELFQCSVAKLITVTWCHSFDFTLKTLEVCSEISMNTSRKNYKKDILTLYNLFTSNLAPWSLKISPFLIWSLVPPIWSIMLFSPPLLIHSASRLLSKVIYALYVCVVVVTRLDKVHIPVYFVFMVDTPTPAICLPPQTAAFYPYQWVNIVFCRLFYHLALSKYSSNIFIWIQTQKINSKLEFDSGTVIWRETESGLG